MNWYYQQLVLSLLPTCVLYTWVLGLRAELRNRSLSKAGPLECEAWLHALRSHGRQSVSTATASPHSHSTPVCSPNNLIAGEATAPQLKGVPAPGNHSAYLMQELI